MKNLSAFLIIVLLATAPSCKWLREKGFLGKRTDTMEVWKARQDSIRVADSIQAAAQLALEREKAVADSIAAAEQMRLARQKYNIIVGSFITPEYARAWEEVYRQKGYQPKLVKLEGTDFEMVAAESYEDLRTALQRLKYFQDNDVFDSWIYVRQ